MNRWLKILIALIVVIAIGLIAAGLYFYNYAVVPGKKDFINENTPGSKVVQTPEGAWFKDDKNRQEWSITSEDGLRLKAIYLPSDKKVIVPLLWRMVIWVRQKRCLSLRKCIMIGATMC